MYASGYMGHYSDFETYQSNLVFDPESSSVIDSEEETTEEGSSDAAEEGENNDDVTSIRSEDSSDSVQDLEVSERPSGSDMSVDHNSDSSDMLSDRWDDTESEEKEGSHAGSDLDSGAASGDPEYGESDGEEVEYDVTDIESDSDNYGILEYDALDGADEYIEYDGADVPGDGETQTRGATREASTGDSYGFESDSIEFYNRSLESLGIIAGCLYFIVFVIIMRYIYRFFRLFI